MSELVRHSLSEQSRRDTDPGSGGTRRSRAGDVSGIGGVTPSAQAAARGACRGSWRESVPRWMAFGSEGPPWVDGLMGCVVIEEVQAWSQWPLVTTATDDRLLPSR